MTIFDISFAYVVGEEGKLSLDPEDRGNWTGGAKGVGVLKGTKYGISAMSYPNEDIAGLTLANAKAIYWSDFWLPAGCSVYSDSVALEVFDSAVNQGVVRAKKILQQALGVFADGSIGPATMAALRQADLHTLAHDFCETRIEHYQLDAGWTHDGDGWTNRANATCAKAVSLI